MYTKYNFKNDAKKMIKSSGYDPVKMAKMAYGKFSEHQRDIDNELYEKLLDIANMEIGKEYEMTEEEFKKFLEEM